MKEYSKELDSVIQNVGRQVAHIRIDLQHGRFDSAFQKAEALDSFLQKQHENILKSS